MLVSFWLCLFVIKLCSRNDNSLTKQGACAMSRLLCNRRVDYDTECQDQTKRTLEPETVQLNEKALSHLNLVQCLFLLHYLLSEEIFTIIVFGAIMKSICNFKFGYLTIKRKRMKLL